MSLRNVSMRWTSWVVLVSAVSIFGCLSSTEEKPGTTPTYLYPTQGDFCAALAAAECNDTVVTACFGSTDQTLEGDRTNCATAREGECNLNNLPYHPTDELTSACIAKMTEVLSDATLDQQEIEDAQEACLPVFSKEGKDGEVCTLNTDCAAAEGYRCVIKPGQASGTCAVPMIVSGGLKCDAPDAVCAEGFYCSAELGNNCIGRPALNEACSSAIPCGEAYKCSDPVMGTCIAKAANGQPCLADEDCTGGFCIPASMGNICVASLQFAATAPICDDYRP